MTMRTTRRTYSSEFRSEAVELAARSGKSITEVERELGLAQVSMRRSGNCYDNALMESFWATLKTELVEEQPFASHAAARCDILLYIEGFYNLRRRHSAPGYLSPMEFERRHLSTLSAPKAVGA